MLAARRETVLKIIVGDYIATAAPVASESIARSYPLGVSPATIRLDMAALEEEGFILRPHHSAGGVPSDKGYRYYVEFLEESRGLPIEEQRLIQHLFYQVEREVEEWLRLTGSVLVKLSDNAAVVTFPRSPECRLKHMELVALHGLRVLLVLVLSQAQLRQRLLSLDQLRTQEELSQTARKLNQAYAGHSRQGIAQQEIPLEPWEEKITQLILKTMEAEEQASLEMQVFGLTHLLTQPEFRPREKLTQVMETVEARAWLNQVAPQGDGIRVIIGQENQEETMRSCSLVLGRYGAPRGMGGVIGILGPTRMRYGQAISSISYMAGLLSELMAEYYV